MLFRPLSAASKPSTKNAKLETGLVALPATACLLLLLLLLTQTSSAMGFPYRFQVSGAESMDLSEVQFRDEKNSLPVPRLPLNFFEWAKASPARMILLILPGKSIRGRKEIKLEGREPPLTLRQDKQYLYFGHLFPCTPVPLSFLALSDSVVLALALRLTGEIQKGTGGRGRDRKCHKLS